MRKKKITVIIEASSTGFGAYSDDLPGVTGYGGTVREAKQDLQDAISSVMEVHVRRKTVPETWLNGGNLDFVYKYDMASLFEHFGMLDITNLAKRIGINPSLLRQYKSGLTLASDKQKQRIEKGLHALGEELLRVRL
ncbi:type II toxin-antitoxin system HicB family antitoxin [Chitinophaga agrisoli]|uniref:Type II toxin-antitoxin system HicB family antitoxin n=1 Tax=Chitinophaga agrisoli TaxID=2607653 RepID=A0A5B2VM85_9BACT|nr:type II toxin-antitoxin system HicB family antitoxin [Chitinophaga agrisoli]KAA2239616.1 type II toxin-antitoxin system HicB family antitoxin [Chitinophaga agrisoli]